MNQFARGEVAVLGGLLITIGIALLLSGGPSILGLPIGFIIAYIFLQ